MGISTYQPFPQLVKQPKVPTELPSPSSPAREVVETMEVCVGGGGDVEPMVLLMATRNPGSTHQLREVGSCFIPLFTRFYIYIPAVGTVNIPLFTRVS